MAETQFDRGPIEGSRENQIHDSMLTARRTDAFLAVDTVGKAVAAVASGAADHLSGKYVTAEDLELSPNLRPANPHS